MAVKRSVTETSRHHTESRVDDRKRRKVAAENEALEAVSNRTERAQVVHDATRSLPPTEPDAGERVVVATGLDEADFASSEQERASSVVDNDTVSDHEAKIIAIPNPNKPKIRLDPDIGNASDLRTRLSSFLPQLAQANEILANQPATHNIEAVDEDGEHIEMNLGLGVLEERHSDDSSSASSTTSSDESDDSDEERDEEITASSPKQQMRQHETNRVSKLMGLSERSEANIHIGIQEVG